MELDTEPIDQAVLALLALGQHEGYRSGHCLTGSDGAAVRKRLITDTVTKAKSVLFTEEGALESERLLQRLFGKDPA